MTGRVESIHIIRGIDMPVERLDAVRVHAGRGLEGDRHTPPEGGSHEPGEFALTLVEAEALQAVRDEHGIDLSDGRSRRQVMTRGIRLNDLVGREFRVGTIRCRAVELCEPCTHLQEMTAPGVTLSFARKDGAWTAVSPASLALNHDAVDTTLQEISELSIVDFDAAHGKSAPALGLDPPKTKIVIRIGDPSPRTLTLSLGAPADAPNVLYASTPGRGICLSIGAL